MSTVSDKNVTTSKQCIILALVEQKLDSAIHLRNCYCSGFGIIDKFLGSLCISGKLPTYPSPERTFCLRGGVGGQ